MKQDNLFNPYILLPECHNCDGSGFLKDENNNIILQEDKRCVCHYQDKLLHANIGMDYWSINQQNFEGSSLDLKKVQPYLDDIEILKETGRGLYLYSPGFGSGKTSLASMLLKKVLFTTPYSALFIPFSDLVIINTRYMLSTFDTIINDKVDAIRNADFLVIDDIGKEYDNNKDNGRATLNSILRFRDMWHKPTIYTANIPLDDNFPKLYGGSNYSIISGRSRQITMENDTDLRKIREAKHTYKDMKKER